jgi:pimeloyl-ACP methyl ester carboxylesterase
MEMIRWYASLAASRVDKAAARGFHRPDADEVPFSEQRSRHLRHQPQPTTRGGLHTAESGAERPRAPVSARLQALGSEFSAFGRMALSRMLHAAPSRDVFDADVPHPTPLVLVHGFFGHLTNFLCLRRFLSAGGLGNFASFSYLPRLDHQRLALLLGQEIAALCRATGSRQVDVVGHSFGGLVARYLVEMENGGPVRRLITLGSPYFSNRLAPQELAIFGAHDPLVMPPDPAHGPRGRVLLVLRCGHLGLLYHPAVLRAVFTFLSAPTAEAAEAAPARDSEGEDGSIARPPVLRRVGGRMAATPR